MPTRHPSSGDLDLEREIDSLYRRPLDQFVAARNRLASALKQSRRAADAARVSDLAKPPVTAWAVNQAWWTDRAAFEAMLDAGTRLRASQRASLEGRGADLRAAVEQRQQAIATVTDLAVRAMGGTDRVGPSMRQRIAGTCDVLATDVPDDVQPGRLDRDLQPGGFGALSAFLPLARPDRPRSPSTGARVPASVTPFRPRDTTGTAAKESAEPAGTPPPAQPADPPDTARPAREHALQVVETAQRALQDARDTLDAERAAVETADRTLSRAQERVEELLRALKEAQRVEAAARTAATEAKRRKRDAETAHEKATAALQSAQRGVERLDRRPGPR